MASSAALSVTATVGSPVGPTPSDAGASPSAASPLSAGPPSGASSVASPTGSAPPAAAAAAAPRAKPAAKRGGAAAGARTLLPISKRDDMPHFSIVFVGHVDAGKSTLSGQILFLTGAVDPRVLEKYEREAKAMSRESWKYAWVLDVSEAEREKGKTHETGTGVFATATRRVTILDAPGHRAYVPSMIMGAAQADVAVLVVSARSGEFETGFLRDGQTREHALLVKTVGVRHLVVAINKMDDPSVVPTWSQERYNEIVSQLTTFLKSVSWTVTGPEAQRNVTFVPISALGGRNINKRLELEETGWYSGPCLFDVFDSIALPSRDESAPLRFLIMSKFKDMGVTEVYGKVESGAFSRGDKVVMLPQRTPVEVEAIDAGDDAKDMPNAVAGDSVMVRVKGVEEEDIRIGSVLCDPGRPIPYTNTFAAKLLVLDQFESILCAGFSCVLHMHAVVEDCVFAKLVCTIDRKTGAVVEKNPTFVRAPCYVMVRLLLRNVVCLEPADAFDRLGRFMLRHEGRTVGVGVVSRVLPASPDEFAQLTAASPATAH